MNRSKYGILMPISKGVNLFRIAHLLCTITSNSHLLISIALHCVSTITYTFVDYYTSTCTSVDGYISAPTTFSSPFMLFMLSQSATPQLHLPSILQ
jgi:hypothetical protein